MPRRIPDARTHDDFDDIVERMPMVLRQRAREFFGTLSESELYQLGVRSEGSGDELRNREIVYLAEELVRMERLLDATDDTLKETEEDYNA